MFSNEFDTEIEHITPQPGMYDIFIGLVQWISRKTIPRGRRTQFITGMSKEAKPLLDRYQNLCGGHYPGRGGVNDSHG